jgi:hypothetical protein
MDALCRYFQSIYDWSNWPGLPIFNEMRLQTAKDLNDKLQEVTNPRVDEATDIEMGDIEYTESLRKRVSELNLEMSLHTSMAAASAPPSYPDLEVEEPPTWDRWGPDGYEVDFGTWKGKRTHDVSHNCVQCRLMQTLMEKHEQVLGDLLSAEMEVSLILDAFTLKPKILVLLFKKSDHDFRVLEEIQLLLHRGEFCSFDTLFRISTSDRRHFLYTSSSLYLVSCSVLENDLQQMRGYN